MSTMELTGVKSGKRNRKKKLKRAVVRLAASKIENKLTPTDSTQHHLSGERRMIFRRAAALLSLTIITIRLDLGSTEIIQLHKETDMFSYQQL